MMQQKTPGVYVEEVSKFPPSVAGVATAVPVFIGFTEIGERFTPVKVTSLLDYTEKFGKDAKLTIDNSKLQGQNFVMYDSIRLFYDNGGGNCYVISVGGYGTTDITAGTYQDNGNLLNQLKKVDEITLICLPDAALLLEQNQLATLQKDILSHCGKMKDRFAILDPKEGKDLDNTMEKFRKGIGLGNLSYGAAYYPYLKTTYTKEISFNEMLKDSDVKKAVDTLKNIDETFKANYENCTKPCDYSQVIPTLQNYYEEKKNQYVLLLNELERFTDSNDDKKLEYRFNIEINEPEDLCQGKRATKVYNDLISQVDDEGNFIGLEAAKIIVKDGKGGYNAEKAKYESLLTAIDKFSIVDGEIKEPEDIASLEEPTVNILKEDLKNKIAEAAQPVLENEILEKALIVRIDDFGNGCYSKALAKYQDAASKITPCGAMAGIYCANDSNKGVWQAPANVSINSVSDLTEMISDNEQEDMNVDPNAGISVNAIRFFSGKGILVWGARTMDGNSNEWRYISVRRLFNYIEESVQKSTAWAVFQPNCSSTWMKIQCQIENFLTSLWREGALAGATPDKAFFVNVGLGVTMTADDINNGNLIVEIGLAAVRPAEFIILQFSHKVQE